VIIKGNWISNTCIPFDRPHHSSIIRQSFMNDDREICAKFKLSQVCTLHTVSKSNIKQKPIP